MRATVRQDRSVRTITIEIEQGPILDISRPWHKLPRTVQVSTVVIRIQDNVVREVVARGGMILKSGEASSSTFGDRSWLRSAFNAVDDIDQAPEWIRTLAREAPTGLTNWTLWNREE